MSKWSEIRNNHCNVEGYVVIDAWLTSDDSEDGEVIAMVNVADGSVAYIDNSARIDKYAQEVIQETIESVNCEDNTIDGWHDFKKQKPTEDGWYICTIEVSNVYRHVMHLYWYSDRQKFIDNIREDMCQTYKVIALNGERLFDVGQDDTDYVVAWKAEPEPFMDGFVLLSEEQ